MKTLFYWCVCREHNGTSVPADERTWPTPEEAIEAASYCIGSDLYVSLFSQPEDAPSLRKWCCDLDLRGRPIHPTAPEREQKANKLRHQGNMHLVKYAKEHYQWSGDMILDLAHILIAWCGMSAKPEDVRLQDIFNHVYNTWELVVPDHQRELPFVLRDHFVWSENRQIIEVEEFIRLMLSGMRFVERSKHPDLPAGDPEILPLNPEATKEGWNEPIYSNS